MKVYFKRCLFDYSVIGGLLYVAYFVIPNM